MATQPIYATKVCTKCGEEHPATKEHFPPVGKGLRPRCRPCWRQYEREYFWANRERKREAAKRKWANADKAEARAKLNEWKMANPDKVREIELRRLQRIKETPELRAKARERVRRHRERLGEEHNRRQREARQAKPEAARGYTKKWRENNLEKARAGYRAYREANPEKVIAHGELRRARMLGAEGEFTGDDVIALIKQHGRVCYYCREKLKKFQVDHFVPLSRGGSNWPRNLVIACRSCNLAKAAKMPWEWKPDRFAVGCSPR
jgi:5-methylcytosine-specific restriction endonuclease McrA